MSIENEQQAEMLLAQAAELLERNWTGKFTKPSLGQYPHQWNWDTAFIAIGLRHIDRDRARTEIGSLLAGQWQSGMLPHIIYPDGPSSYFPTPDFWRTEGLAHGPSFPTSGLTQPPVLATAVRLLDDASEGDSVAHDFLAATYPRLVAWHRWLHSARDPGGTGLVAIIHPWESGTDNSTRFTLPLQDIGRVSPPEYQRRDQKHVDSSERPVADDYDRFMHLIGHYRDLGWDDGEIWREAPFLVQDVLFNSVLHRADRDLRELALRLGEPTAEIDAWLAAGRSAIEERLWDETTGAYLDRDLRAGRLIQENTVATLMPLFSGAIARERAHYLVRRQLLDPRHYAPADDSSYFVPSASKSSPLFEPRRYWRGPIWLNTNWLIIRGLEEYGYREEAARVRRDTLELGRRSGFVEYFDPRDGSACGARGFSWSAALVVDLLSTA